MPRACICVLPLNQGRLGGRAKREGPGRAIPRSLGSFYIKAEQKSEYLFVRDTEGPSIGREYHFIDDRYDHDVDELLA
jgi:hypothetical protein